MLVELPNSAERHTKDAILPNIAHIVRLLQRHGECQYGCERSQGRLGVSSDQRGR